jgi:hypothetical protein
VAGSINSSLYPSVRTAQPYRFRSISLEMPWTHA